MQLYGYYRSSASYRIRIILNLKEIEWDYEAVRLDRGEQREPGFLAQNPSGLVPVLQDGDTRIAQSAAIAEYLEETHPRPALLPGVPAARAAVREMMAVIGCDIHPLQNLRVLNRVRDDLGGGDAGVRRWIHHWIGAGFGAFEALLERHGSDGRHSFGGTITLADAWLVPQVYNARRHELDLAPYPLIRSVDAYCRELPAFAAAAPARQPDAPA
ncbi:MAG: maleylacetoacetate isomerase [Woeseiaceae bacterium]|nr:maleylacetoacetate isomerase [Woeseiaceae bacterium]